MTAIKSYTDLEQSKKLAEILPIESADMYYPWYIKEDGNNIKSGHRISIPSVGNFIHKVNILPCWSLAALLSVIPDYTLQTNTDGTVFVVCESKKPMISDSYNNPVDACYEMIIRLHELNLL